MNRFDKKLISKLKKEKHRIDNETEEMINNVLENLPEKQIKTKRIFTLKKLTLIAPVTIAFVIILLVNTNKNVALAVQDIPILGNFIKIITVWNYEYDNDYNSISINAPEIVIVNNGSTVGADEINSETRKLINSILNQFKDNISDQKSHGSLNISYQIITDTNEWFTLKLIISQTSGSSGISFKYYHIDKSTGESVQLSDLFKNDKYIEAISSEIKSIMNKQMEEDKSIVYWLDIADIPEWNFDKIDKNQSFYFDDEDNIVIVFDKYIVGPGSMGCPEFTIPSYVYSDYLK